MVKNYTLLGALVGALIISLSLNAFLYLKHYHPSFLVVLVDIFNPAPVPVDSDHKFGSSKPDTIVIEYSDFQCPYCNAFHANMRRLLQENESASILWVKRHFPLGGHKYAIQAAIASECAADQKKFWEYADALYQEQKQLEQKNTLVRLAQKLGIDKERFEDCLSSAEKMEIVENHLKEGNSRGIVYTPTVYINGKRQTGKLDMNVLVSKLVP